LRLRTELENALASLLQLAPELERDPVMLETIQGLIRDAREPFLFVVVGEVKAGKSSLLNALFGQSFAQSISCRRPTAFTFSKYARTSNPSMSRLN